MTSDHALTDKAYKIDEAKSIAPTCTANGSNHYVIDLLKFTYNEKEYTLTVEFNVEVKSEGHQHDADAKVYTWIDTITEDGVEVEYKFYGKLCNSTCNQLIIFDYEKVGNVELQ